MASVPTTPLVEPLVRDTELPDPRLLRLFDRLYATRSVTRTAEQLGQTQPTVSLGLARLRRHLGDPLFVRAGTGMQPTPRAEALIEPARRALAALASLVDPSPPFAPSTVERKFRICMTDASHVTLLPSLLARVRADAPGVRLEAATITPGIGEALQSGEADLALGLIAGLDAGFYQQTLFEQDWICLTGPRHPRLGSRLTLKAYREEGHINIVYGTGQHLLTTALKAHGIERRVVLELPGFLGLPAMLRGTDLIATLPRQIGETLASANGLKVHACPLRIPSFMVKQHWHARYHEDAGNRWLRGVCADLFLQSRPRPSGRD